MTHNEQNDEAILLGRAVARLRSSIMALTFGLAGGLVLFVATAWLVMDPAHAADQSLWIELPLGEYIDPMMGMGL